MTKPTGKMPIAGHPHLALAHQDNDILQRKTLSMLREQGFSVEANRLVPPDGATGREIIAAITRAFHTAKAS